MLQHHSAKVCSLYIIMAVNNSDVENMEFFVNDTSVPPTLPPVIPPACDVYFDYSQQKTLDECENFARSLLAIISDLRQYGSTNNIKENYLQLCYPILNLEAILGIMKLPRNVLRGKDLHHYLKSKLVSSDDTHPVIIQKYPTAAELCPMDRYILF